MPVSNKVYSFEDTNVYNPGSNRTKVSIQSTRGLGNGTYIDIFRSVSYRGTHAISNVTPTSFEIDLPFTLGDVGAIWQVSRPRPVAVNPEGETIDSLRQALNAISGDVGNKNELDPALLDRRDVVGAINSLKMDQLWNLILSIATN